MVYIGFTIAIVKGIFTVIVQCIKHPCLGQSLNRGNMLKCHDWDMIMTLCSLNREYCYVDMVYMFNSMLYRIGGLAMK